MGLLTNNFDCHKEKRIYWIGFEQILFEQATDNHT